MLQAFQLTEMTAVVILICGCCPGGNLSNILALALNGDMNLRYTHDLFVGTYLYTPANRRDYLLISLYIGVAVNSVQLFNAVCCLLSDFAQDFYLNANGGVCFKFNEFKNTFSATSWTENSS